VPDIGEKERIIMKIKKMDRDMPIGTLNRIKDVLPSPEKLAMPQTDCQGHDYS